MNNSECFFNSCIKLWNDTILNYLTTWRNIPSTDKKRMIDAMVEVVECLRLNRNAWEYSEEHYNGGEEEKLAARVDQLYVSLNMSKDEETDTTDALVSFMIFLGRRGVVPFSFHFMIDYGDEGSNVFFSWDIDHYQYYLHNDAPLSKSKIR